MDNYDARTCGLQLETNNDDQEYALNSVLGPLISSMESFFNVDNFKDRDKIFTREKYFQELQSQLSTSSGYSSLESLPNAYKKLRNTLISSQSLGIVILLEDTTSHRKIVQELKSGSWKFHHTMQLLDWENNCVIAKQDFFEISSELPLVSASLTKTNKNIIRYNIFVRNKQRMQHFYENVLQMYPSFETEDYCCFVLKSTDNFEIQFSLKLSRHLDINVTKNSQLIFQVPKISRSFFRNVRRRNIVQTCDPEGNLLILVTSPSLWNMPSKGQRQLQRMDKKHCSTTRLGDCSIIRTRKKSSEGSSSTYESDNSSVESVFSQDGIIFSGCPITL